MIRGWDYDYKVDEPPEKEKPSLSVGDALTIGILAAFIFGWLIFIGTTDVGESSSEDDISSFESFITIVFIIGPPLWAGSLIGTIVRK